MLEQTRKRLFTKYHSIVESGVDQVAERPYRTPASAYTDPDRLKLERDYVFRGAPTAVALSCDVPKPGTAYSTIADGIPLLIIRDSKGKVRVFVNGCRHRATAVFQGRGQIPPAITCPYHAWTYKQDGTLFKRPQAETCFTGIEKKDLSLVQLPSDENHGLIVARLDGQGEVNATEWLGEFVEDFDAYGLADYCHIATEETSWDFNWKIAMDGFLENYHLFALHNESIYRYMDAWPLLTEERGKHLLTLAPWRSLAEESDPLAILKHATVQHLLFPNFLVTHQIDHVETWQFFPDGDNPDRCVIRTGIYAPQAPVSDRQRNYFVRNLEIVMNVVTTEDFPQAESMQRAIKSRQTAPEVIFGQNEAALAHFHGMLDAAISAQSSA
ncbi:aromatic ring-hydroxylating dioxygenase subunit alpha [Rhodococcus erythropolis]